MAEYKEGKDEMLRIFDATINEVKRVHREDLVDQLTETAQRLRDGRLMVVICGEIKQGKTSLLNALIDEPDLFPVDVDVVTSLVSYAVYGDQEEILITDNQQVKTITRQQIDEYVNEQTRLGSSLKGVMVVARLPNSKLKDDLILVDTPGMGGLNHLHLEVTYSFTPNADVIIHVSDALSPLNDMELKFLLMIRKHCPNIIHVLTKIDMQGDYDVILQNNQKKLEAVLGSQPEIIPISTRLKEKYLKKGDPEDLTDSHFLELEKAIWDVLNHDRGKILLDKAFREAQWAINEIGVPLKLEFNTLIQNTQQEFEKTEKELQAAHNRLETLRSGKFVWQEKLQTSLNKISLSLNDQFEDSFDNVIYQVTNDYIRNDTIVVDIQKLGDLADVEIAGLFKTISKSLDDHLPGLYNELEAMTGVSLNRSVDRFFRQPSNVSMPDKIYNANPSNTAEDLTSLGIDIFRYAGITGFYGAAAGAAVLALAAVFFPVIGVAIGPTVLALQGLFPPVITSVLITIATAIGSTGGPVLTSALGGSLLGMAGGTTLGGLAGARRSMKQSEKKKLDAIRAEHTSRVMRYLKAWQRQIQRAMRDAMRALGETLRADLQQQFTAQLETNRKLIETVKKQQHMTAIEVKERTEQLNSELQPIYQIEADIEKLRSLTS